MKAGPNKVNIHIYVAMDQDESTRWDNVRMKGESVMRNKVIDRELSIGIYPSI